MKYVLMLILVLITGCTVAPLPYDEEAKLNTDLSFLNTPKSGIYYKVKEGDTLWKIAKMHNVNLNELIQANQDVLKGGQGIRAGQLLFVPTAKESVQPIVQAESEFIWPVKGAILGTPSENGINIKNTYGAPVVAVKSGVVTYVDEKWPGLGKIVVIKHSDGFTSLYGYNSEIEIKAGDKVKQGQIIAKVGKTGRADEAQLHFKLMKNEQLVNPLSYLR